MLLFQAPGKKGPARPMFQLRFTDGGELVLTEGGKKKRAGVWIVTPTQLDEDLAHLGPDALDIDATTLAPILARERRQLHPLLRDQRALAGIGRKNLRRGLQLFGLLAAGAPQEPEVRSVASAPFAQNEMKPQTRALGATQLPVHAGG